MSTAGQVHELRQSGYLHPGDGPFDEARRVWNAMIDRQPAEIAQCRRLEDVVAAVLAAGRSGRPVSIRGGGHNIAGTAVGEGALMVDLREMRAVRIDPDRRIAEVEGGATWADLDAAAQKHELATPGGVVSSTGVAGLTLGGGFGWLARLHGLAADNLISVELVLADGRVVNASASGHPDLFWALRGGSGNFGVVTRLTFQLHRQNPEVLFGPAFFALEDAGDVLRTYAVQADALPRTCCVWANLMTAPPVPVLPEAMHGQKVLTLMQCCAGDPDSGREALTALYGGIAPAGDGLMPRAYVDAQQFLDPVYEFGARNYWRSHNHTRLSPDLIDTLIELTPDLPTPESELLICQLGGAIADVDRQASAFPHRQFPFISTPGVRWHDAAQDHAVIEWLKKASDRIAEHAGPGAYVNFIAEPEGRAKDAYGVNYGRLSEIKRTYDPENRFRVNQNITPANPS